MVDTEQLNLVDTEQFYLVDNEQLNLVDKEQLSLVDTEHFSLVSHDLLSLTRIGRALVVSGRNPGGQAGFNIINLGITNLSPTVKTDLANRYVWLLSSSFAIFSNTVLICY